MMSLTIARVGEHNSIKKQDPLRDTMEVTIRGYELSLKKADAEMIEVE